MRMVHVAAIQMQMCDDPSKNVATAERLVSQAAAEGAQIILLPELFEHRYFCKDKDRRYFSLAETTQKSRVIQRFRVLAETLKVVLPISYFERCDGDYYNALVVIDADGSVLQNYRKTHIPDGKGYEETFYFSPGNSGFQVWNTRYARIGVAICWDQWFPETARSLTLMGAELIFFPTAIGSEPEMPIDSCGHWQRVQMGHAAANTVPVIAANRFGNEVGHSCSVTFYGSSFITDGTGEKIAEAPRQGELIISASFDLQGLAAAREYWSLLRDRRPQCYQGLVAF